MKKRRKNINQLKALRLRKPNYSKLTFRLSFIGFLGSIGFYFGVLRQVYSEPESKHQIEQLQTENESLKNQVNILIEEINEDE